MAIALQQQPGANQKYDSQADFKNQQSLPQTGVASRPGLCARSILQSR